MRERGGWGGKGGGKGMGGRGDPANYHRGPSEMHNVEPQIHTTPLPSLGGEDHRVMADSSFFL